MNKKNKNNTFVVIALLVTGIGVLPIAYCHGGGIGVINSTTTQKVYKPVAEATQKVDNNYNSDNSNEATDDNDSTTDNVATDLSFSMPRNDSMAQKIHAIDHPHPDVSEPVGNKSIINELESGNNILVAENDEVVEDNKDDVDTTLIKATDIKYDFTNLDKLVISQTDALISQIKPSGFCSPEALAVGITHYRYEDANPDDLVRVGSRKLHHDAVEPLKLMKAAAKRDGVILTVGSAYRSIRYQQGIISRKKKRGLSDKQIYTVSAPAGYSEHSTGYAVDFYPIDSRFAKSKAYSWLQEHASAYDWEQSFTPEVSERNGVIVEPWHWRYVGTPDAKQLFVPKPCYQIGDTPQ